MYAEELQKPDHLGVDDHLARDRPAKERQTFSSRDKRQSIASDYASQTTSSPSIDFYAGCTQHELEPIVDPFATSSLRDEKPNCLVKLLTGRKFRANGT
jgi:hypothetical protein